MSTGSNKINITMVALGLVFLLLSMLVAGDLSSVTLTNPTDGVEISGTSTLTASVSDHATTVYFYYQESGGSTWNLIGSTTNDTYPDTAFSYSWVTTGVSDGTYDLNATATNGTTYVSHERTGVIVNNVVIPTPTNLVVSDVLNDQGGSLYLYWDWSGETGDLETFTLERKLEGGDWAFLANTTYNDYTDGTSLSNSQTYCYHLRAVGTDGDVSSWTGQVCEEPNAEPVIDQINITPSNPTVNDTVQCVGFIHDIDDSSGLSVSYEISGIRYPSSNLQDTGTVSCVAIPSGNQWTDITAPGSATHECVVTINDIQKGDKYTCYMTPYDGEEYGSTENTSTVYINNSAPWATNVLVNPEDSNSSSTLTCNYTFNDLDSDPENTTEALFKWYRNIDGQNDWIEIEGQTEKTLKNTETQTWFSKDDQIKCSVMVKDQDITWDGYKNPLYDSQYRNSTVRTIGGNEEPGLTYDYSNAGTVDDAVALGDNVMFYANWTDDGDQVRLMVCDEFIDEEQQYSSGADNVSFGNQSTVWIYTNQTGLIAETISIKPFDWQGSGSTTNHTYDIYAYEVDAVGDTTGILIGKVNDVAFSIDKYNKFNLEYSAAAYPDKYIGFQICADTDNDETCDNGLDAVYIHANSTQGTYTVKEINTTGERTLYDPEIKINYDTSSNGCKSRTYCNTTLGGSNPISCSYNTSSLNETSLSYEIRIYDSEGASSEIRSNTFYINRRPLINYVEANPQYPSENEDILCNFSSYDPDGHTTTNETYWYYKNDGGNWIKYLSETDFINKSTTSSGQTWMCEVTVADQYGLSTSENSTVAVVGGTSINGTAPVIIDITTNNYTNPVNAGLNLDFVVNWDMVNKTGKKLVLFICNSSEISAGGCGGRVFYQSPGSGEYLNSPHTISYQTNETDESNQTFYSRICKDDGECSDIYAGSFYVNHRPLAENVQVVPQNANENSVLSCNYTYNSSDTVISDSEDTNNTSFRWYINNVLESENRTISGIFSTNDNITCGVKVADILDYSDDEYINSSEITVLPYPSVPSVWSIPELTNEDKIFVVGYVRNSLNATVQTLDENNTPTFNYSTDLKNTRLLGSSTVAESVQQGKNYIKVNMVSGFNSTSYLKIASHDLDNYLYYNITGRSTIKINNTDVYRLTITPALKESVNLSTAVYAYNDTYPGGWFNISINLWNGTNDIGVWGTNSIGDGEMYSSDLYRDSQSPQFNLSLIPDGTVSDSEDMFFNVTDDYGLNASTIEVNITNSTSQVLYYDYTNVTCLNYSTWSFCYINPSLGEGTYNMTFKANDTVNNTNSTVKQFVVDKTKDVAPDVTSEELVHTTRLTMSWIPTSVYALQYSLGDDPYPTTGWNSIIDWTNSTSSQISAGNLTTSSLSLVDDETYFFNVKYKKYSWSDWSYVGSSNSIKYIESQSTADEPTPVVITVPRELHNTEIMSAEWTESTASEGYEIIYYEYAIGTAKYPDTGWNTTSSGWVNNSLNTTVSKEFNLTNRETYYFNVRAADSCGLFSNVSSSGPITYYNQISPTATVISVENDTVLYDGWLDEMDNSYTNISIQGNRNITCYYSQNDRKFVDMESFGDSKCNASGEWGQNLTCQVPNLSEGSYTYHISCKDSDGREQSNTENTDVSFDVDINGPVITVSYPEELNFTLRQGKFGVNDTFIINVTDDPGGVKEVNFTIKDSNSTVVKTGNLTSTNDRYTYKWYNLNQSSGNYSILIESLDNYNHADSYTRNFTFDKTPPTITLDTSGEVNESYFHDDFNITTRIQDFVNVSYVVVGTNLTNSTNSTGYGNDYNWTSLINTSGLSDDQYTINYTAKDSVNNTATDSIEFYVDKHAWFNSSSPISNYTWSEDVNLTDIFDLDDHFVNTTNASYTTTGNSRIRIEITNGSVSLIPNDDWYGVEYVVFRASDPYGIIQPSNNVTLTVQDDYCNPPSSGTWEVNQTQVAQCRSDDQDLLNDINNISVVETSVLNITNLEIDYTVYFLGNSTGYARNSVFTDTIYLKENSTLTAWNTTFDTIILGDNATLTVYNSPATIEILNVDGNQNLQLENVAVGSATFRRTRGEINRTTINSSTFYISGAGEIYDLDEITSNGYINTTNMFLNFTEANMTSITVDASAASSLTITDSSFSNMINRGNLSLVNSNITNFEMRGNSITNSTNSTVGTLVPNMSVGEVSILRGNLTVNDARNITSGGVLRYYPLYVYNGQGSALDNVNVTLSSQGTTSSSGYSLATANFTSSNNEISLYLDGLNLQNISLIDDTPLNITNWWLDPDGDGTSILNDEDDDNDGFNDTEDYLTGNVSWVETNVQNLNISVNSSYNLSQRFTGNVLVNITDSDGDLTNFYWNFSESTLGLQYINITKGRTSDQREYIVISGLDLQGNNTKTVYLNKTNSTSKICVIDTDYVTVSSITSNTQCSGGTILECPDSSGSYSCSLINNQTFNVTGLSNTGLIQLSETTTTVTTTTVTDGGSSGGGGGGGAPSSLSISVSENQVDITGIGISSGSYKIISIDDWSGRIYKIGLYAKQVITGGYLKIERLGPLSVWEVPSLGNNVYHYFKIDSDIGDKTRKIEFYFSVDKDWIESNSFDNIYLWRYKDKWQRLSTEFVEEKDGYMNYKSNFSEFSHFAVVGERDGEIIMPGGTTTTITDNICGDGVCEKGEDVNNCPEDCKEISITGEIWYVVIPSLFLIFVIFLAFKEKFSNTPGKIKTFKKTIPTPPPPPKTKIRDILSNPVSYLGKTVNIEGDLNFIHYAPEENKVLYKIKDDSGVIHGFSRNTNYHGHEKIQGLVRRTKDNNIYLYF